MIIHIKSKNFEKILNGKTVEGRLYRGIFKIIKKDMIITFKSEDKYLDVIVNNINIYNDLDEYLNNQDLNKIGPGLSKDDIKDSFINCYSLKNLNNNKIISIEFNKLNLFK